MSRLSVWSFKYVGRLFQADGNVVFVVVVVTVVVIVIVIVQAGRKVKKLIDQLNVSQIYNSHMRVPATTYIYYTLVVLVVATAVDVV